MILFSKDVLIKSDSKDFYIVTKNFISNKCCSIQFLIPYDPYHGFLNIFLFSTLIIINVSWEYINVLNQNI